MRTSRRSAAPALAALLLVPLLALPLAPAAGQSLASRVSSAPEGTVRLTFAARDGVCGDGRSFIADDIGPNGESTFYWMEGSSFGFSTGTTISGRGRCDPGPVRVHLTVSDRRVVDVRPYVGGRPGDFTGTDLGTVAAAEAATYLLSVAAEGEERVARGAILAASIADSARIAPALLAMAKNKSLRPATRDHALRWLARVAEREGFREADGVARQIASDESEPRTLRERAIRVLSQSSQNDAYLRGLYGSLTEVSLKERVLRTLGESHTSASAEWVRQIALDEREPLTLRERAIRVLGEEAGRGSLARDLYAKLDEPTLKDRVLRAAGEEGDAASMRWIRSIAESRAEPMALRDRAIRILGEKGEGSFLRDLFGKLEEAPLKERLLRMAAEAGGSENVGLLRQTALDSQERPELRDRALRSLGESGQPTAELVKLYDAMEQAALRDRLARVLGERGDRAALDKLLDIAKNDPDAALRRRATRLLAEKGDDRVKELIK